jgi:hypothetical protein
LGRDRRGGENGGQSQGGKTESHRQILYPNDEYINRAPPLRRAIEYTAGFPEWEPVFRRDALGRTGQNGVISP